MIDSGGSIGSGRGIKISPKRKTDLSKLIKLIFVPLFQRKLILVFSNERLVIEFF